MGLQHFIIDWKDQDGRLADCHPDFFDTKEAAEAAAPGIMNAMLNCEATDWVRGWEIRSEWNGSPVRNALETAMDVLGSRVDATPNGDRMREVVDVLKAILDQRGCEHLPDCHDGYLTSGMDAWIYG